MKRLRDLYRQLRCPDLERDCPFCADERRRVRPVEGRRIQWCITHDERCGDTPWDDGEHDPFYYCLVGSEFTSIRECVAVPALIVEVDE